LKKGVPFTTAGLRFIADGLMHAYTTMHLKQQITARTERRSYVNTGMWKRDGFVSCYSLSLVYPERSISEI